MLRCAVHCAECGLQNYILEHLTSEAVREDVVVQMEAKHWAELFNLAGRDGRAPKPVSVLRCAAPPPLCCASCFLCCAASSAVAMCWAVHLCVMLCLSGGDDVYYFD